MSMEYLVTFLEGVVTFVSPCLLPMIPLYLAYFAGGSAKDAGEGLAHTLACALCFVLGFGMLFTLLGAGAGTLGAVLLGYKRVLDIVCGLFVIALGLGYVGILRLPAVSGRKLAARARVMPRTPAKAFVFGVVFAVGWTPCVGTFLASALSLAATSANAVRGVLLLICYSAGLGIPFVASALLVDQLEGAIGWVKSHYRLVEQVSGWMLVAVGVLMASGLMGTLLNSLT